MRTTGSMVVGDHLAGAGHEGASRMRQDNCALSNWFLAMLAAPMTDS
jgi:hypothetical protein